eukprot:Pgem_evm1s7624
MSFTFRQSFLLYKIKQNHLFNAFHTKPFIGSRYYSMVNNGIINKSNLNIIGNIDSNNKKNSNIDKKILFDFDEVFVKQNRERIIQGYDVRYNTIMGNFACNNWGTVLNLLNKLDAEIIQTKKQGSLFRELVYHDLFFVLYFSSNNLKATIFEDFINQFEKEVDKENSIE